MVNYYTNQQMFNKKVDNFNKLREMQKRVYKFK